MLIDFSQQDIETMERLLEATANGDLTPLYEALGRNDPETMGWGPESLPEIIHTGRIWWEKNEPLAREAVCGSTLVREVFGRDHRGTLLAIATALGPAFPKAYAIIVPVLVLQLGLDVWCRPHWEQTEQGDPK